MDYSGTLSSMQGLETFCNGEDLLVKVPLGRRQICRVSGKMIFKYTLAKRDSSKIYRLCKAAGDIEETQMHG